MSEIKVNSVVNSTGDNDSGLDLATNDQVKVKIANAEDFIFKANSLEVQTGSNIDMNGNELILDADGDTSIEASTDDTIVINTAGSESMRINSDGDLIVNGTDSGGGAITAYNVANAYAPPIVELNNVATDFSAAMFELRVSSGSINSTNGRFIHCYSDNGSTTKMKVLGDGDIENVNNNYTGISDLKLKENIADSNSQWNDLKNLKVKKFSFKADKKDKADKIGVIAQDLEASNMSGLVRESKDFDSEGNDLGTTTKSVKYSILYMKAVKALQEAMARIETLEAKVTALESE
tara:strand:- start:228 stop:1106 length:879 start_codon:yes stop_codon:yes gene_type:complete